MKTFKHKAEAEREKIRRDNATPKKDFCPQINSFCRTDCVCYMERQVIPANSAKTAYRVQEWYCIHRNNSNE